MMNDSRIQVLLLTGYLGSGKTTLVNRILSNRKGIRFAVIVNDIGEVNIDASLIAKEGIVGSRDESLVALQNGCICCTLKMDLVEQLRDLCMAGKFDYIVIEASGICEPAPIAQTICSVPQITGGGFPLPVLDNIVTVVDALRLSSEFGCGASLEKEELEDDDIERLLIEQIEFCNTILINKASLVKPDELKQIRSIIKALQPKARILECDWCNVPLERLLDTNEFDFEKVALSAAWIDAIEGEGHDSHASEHEHHHHEEEGEALEYGIDTFVYYRRLPFDMNRFDYILERRWPSSIIRAKGMCYFSNEPDRCYLFEQAGVQKSIRDAGLWFATMSREELAEEMLRNPALAADWDDEYGDRMIKIVIIGRNMDRQAICDALDSAHYQQY